MPTPAGYFPLMLGGIGPEHEPPNYTGDGDPPEQDAGTVSDFVVLCIHGCGKSFRRSQAMRHNAKHHPMAVCVALGHKGKKSGGLESCARCGTLFKTKKAKV